MATLSEDLARIEYITDKLVNNRVANFAYTQEAYDNDNIDGVSEYDVNNAQNIPTADAETLDVNSTVLNKGYRSQASSITRMLMNHFLGRTSYNLNKAVDMIKKGFLGIKNALGEPQGIATLDENGYLSKGQIKPVLTDEKLKEFLLSNKVPSLKELGRYFHSSTTVQYVFTFSISDTEDIILLVVDGQFQVYKYDGKNYTSIPTSQTGNASLIGNYSGYLGRYDDKEIFYNSYTPNLTIQIVCFDYYTLRFTVLTHSIDRSTDAVFLNTENGKIYAFPQEQYLYVDNTDMNQVDYTLFNLNTMTSEEGYFYVPNIGSIPDADSATFLFAMNNNLLIIYQANSPNGYRAFVYDINNLSTTTPTTSEVNLLDSEFRRPNNVISNKDSSVLLLRPNSTIVAASSIGVFIKGKILSITVKALLTFIRKSTVIGNAIIIEQVDQTNYTTYQIYSLDGSKQFLSTYAPKEVYKDILLIGNSYVDVASANFETVKKDYPLEGIIKSNIRAYTLKKNSEDKLYLNEITNVLD